ALIIGLWVANWLHPGVGTGLDPTTIMHQNASEAAGILSNAKTVAGSHDWSHFLLSMIPESPVGAMAEGKILQVVFFSVMFALALMASGDKGKPILEGLESLSDVMFKLVGMVMRFAPLGVFGALASAVALNGTKVFGAYLNLIGSLYLALGIFLVLVPGLTCLCMGISIPRLFKAIADPLLLAFTTTSSESAMPKAMESLQRFGVPKDIVSFVLPTGYSFNLDGSTLYLCLAALFIAQVLHVPLSPQEQVTLVLTLMVTSKGVAAVPRASLVILAGTLAAFKIPVEGVALLLGVDHVLDMARTSVNLLGNCVASAVVAKWEGVLQEPDAMQVAESLAVPPMPQGDTPLAETPLVEGQTLTQNEGPPSVTEASRSQGVTLSSMLH
ncbi:MAG: dicarboxylate/amino acid:cation symporter, partial [Vampirovibrionales bacterium]